MLHTHHFKHQNIKFSLHDYTFLYLSIPFWPERLLELVHILTTTEYWPMKSFLENQSSLTLNFSLKMEPPILIAIPNSSSNA